MHAMTDEPATKRWTVRSAFELGVTFLCLTAVVRMVVASVTGLRDPWMDDRSELPPYEDWVRIATLTAPITLPIIALPGNWTAGAFRWLVGPSIDPRRPRPAVMAAAEATERTAIDSTTVNQGDSPRR